MSGKQKSLNDFVERHQLLQVTSLNATLEADELTIEVKIKLADLKTLYQLLNYKIYFNNKLMEEKYLKIPFPFTKTEFTLPIYILNLLNIKSGTYKVRVEVTGIWPRSSFDFKETFVTYQPELEAAVEEAFPTIKSIKATSPVEIVTEDISKLIEGMRERFRKEIRERRDYW